MYFQTFEIFCTEFFVVQIKEKILKVQEWIRIIFPKGHRLFNDPVPRPVQFISHRVRLSVYVTVSRPELYAMLLIPLILLLLLIILPLLLMTTPLVESAAAMEIFLNTFGIFFCIQAVF